VLPCAINRDTVVAIGSAGDPSEDGLRHMEAVAIDMGQARDRFALSNDIAATDNSWQNIIRGVTAVLQRYGYTPKPARLAIAGDVPIGAGLSSSASMAVAVALALSEFAQLNLSPTQVATIAREAENDFVGVPCGIMDQMASAASTAGSALLLDCRSLEHMPIPVSEDLAVVIIDSGVRRELTNSAFAERRRECEAAARHYGVTWLRDLSVEALEEGRAGLDPVIFSRARHVVTEIARVEPTAVALAYGDTAALSEVMRASHVSLRDDFAVSVIQLDRLVDVISAVLGRGPGARGGVRLTGAGFGGCVVAVTHKAAAEDVIKAVEATFNQAADVPAQAEVYKIAGGAAEIANPY